MPCTIIEHVRCNLTRFVVEVEPGLVAVCAHSFLFDNLAKEANPAVLRFSSGKAGKARSRVRGTRYLVVICKGIQHRLTSMPLTFVAVCHANDVLSIFPIPRGSQLVQTLMHLSDMSRGLSYFLVHEAVAHIRVCLAMHRTVCTSAYSTTFCTSMRVVPVEIEQIIQKACQCTNRFHKGCVKVNERGCQITPINRQMTSDLTICRCLQHTYAICWQMLIVHRCAAASRKM